MNSGFREALNTKFLITTILLLGLGACTSPDSGSGTNENSTEVLEESPDVQRLDIFEEVFNLSIALPQDYALDNPPRINFNPAFGHMEVKCGEVFALIITEESGNIDETIEQLERDLVFKYEIEDQTNRGLLYKQFIPGSDREFWHFYVMVPGSVTGYVVRDAQMDELNAHQSRKIYDAIVYGATKYNEDSPS